MLMTERPQTPTKPAYLHSNSHNKDTDWFLYEGEETGAQEGHAPSNDTMRGLQAQKAEKPCISGRLAPLAVPQVSA